MIFIKIFFLPQHDIYIQCFNIPFVVFRKSSLFITFIIQTIKAKGRSLKIIFQNSQGGRGGGLWKISGNSNHFSFTSNVIFFVSWNPMQNFITLGQPFLGEKQPKQRLRAVHALRSNHHYLCIVFKFSSRFTTWNL